jgi:hypothetical protein
MTGETACRVHGARGDGSVVLALEVGLVGSPRPSSPSFSAGTGSGSAFMVVHEMRRSSNRSSPSSLTVADLLAKVAGISRTAVSSVA